MAKGIRYYAWIAPCGITPDAPLAYGNTVEQAIQGLSMVMLGIRGKDDMVLTVMGNTGKALWPLYGKIEQFQGLCIK